MKKFIHSLAVILVCSLILSACSKKEQVADTQEPVQQAPAPLAAKYSFTVADPNNIFENQVIQLKNESTGFDYCVWEFGNAPKVRSTDATISYPVHGYYTVKLTVFDKNGQSQSFSQEFSILCNFTNGQHTGSSTN